MSNSIEKLPWFWWRITTYLTVEQTIFGLKYVADYRYLTGNMWRKKLRPQEIEQKKNALHYGLKSIEFGQLGVILPEIFNFLWG